MEEIVLSKEELSRYSRHIIIPEVGLEGQKKLKAAKVLVVGTGGKPFVIIFNGSRYWYYRDCRF